MKNELIVISDPKSPEAETFKNLRTNIQFMNADSDKKVMLITSTVPGEGKSYISSNLACTFAQINKKVLLIDMDMRKGRQYGIFDVNPRPGLSNYLSGVVDQDFVGNTNDINNYIQSTKIENLFIITAGSVPPNPSELLISNKMQNLIPKLGNMFDVVIFDAPPSVIVTDACIISRLVDFCLIVTAQNVTKSEDLLRAVNAIKSVNGKIAGVVLNKVKLSGKAYEHSYYYGDKYAINTKPTRRK